MTRKTALKILISIVVLAILIVVYVLFFTGNNERNGSVNIPGQPTSNFFPDSEDFDSQQNNGDNNNQNNQEQDRFNIPNLRQISQNPVAGYILLTKESLDSNTLDGNSIDEQEIIYRYVNRSNGNILETTSKTTETKRLTNDTIPKVYESIFSEDGQNVLFRYLEGNRIKTVLGTLEQNGTTTEVIGDESTFTNLETTFLTDDISSVDVRGGSVLYSVDDGFGLNIFSFSFENIDQQNFVFSSDILELTPKWLNENIILLGTKPSKNSEGYLFEHDIENETTIKILDGQEGFNFITKPNSNFIVYSEINNFVVDSYSYNLETGDIVNLELNTIVSDKCTWSNVVDTIIYCAEPNTEIGSDYPNIWYQGQVSLNDSIYRIDVESGLKIEISGLNENFDITNLKVSEQDDFITFINKKDLTLWSLDI